MLLFVLGALWAVASPIYAAPDETVHAVKAAGTADFQFRGVPDAIPGNSAESFEVPKVLLQGFTTCYRGNPDVSAGCLAPFQSATGSVRIASYVGRYPPAYYFFVGLPALVFPHSYHLVLYMRLVSAFLAAIFLAAAFVSATQIRGRRYVMLGVAAAVSPMELFLAGTVNPSGIEIASALALWSSGLALFSDPEPRYRRRLVVWTALSAAAFVSSRGLSPLYLVITTVILALVAGRRRIVEILRRRDAQVALGLVSVVSVLDLVWIVTQSALADQGGHGVKKSTPRLTIVRLAFDRDVSVHQMVGVFGWLDTELSNWVYEIWEGVLIALVVLVVLRRAWRLLGVGLLLAIVVMVLPTALSYAEVKRFGLVGQARYILPLAVGLPVLAAYALGTQRQRLERFLVPAVAAALATVQIAAYLQGLRRYRTGQQHPVFVLHAAWSPALPWLFIIVVYAVVTVGYGVWWIRLSQPPRRQRPEMRRPPTGETATTGPVRPPAAGPAPPRLRPTPRPLPPTLYALRPVRIWPGRGRPEGAW